MQLMYQQFKRTATAAGLDLPGYGSRKPDRARVLRRIDSTNGPLEPPCAAVNRTQSRRCKLANKLRLGVIAPKEVAKVLRAVWAESCGLATASCRGRSNWAPGFGLCVWPSPGFDR